MVVSTPCVTRLTVADTRRLCCEMHQRLIAPKTLPEASSAHPGPDAGSLGRRRSGSAGRRLTGPVGDRSRQQVVARLVPAEEALQLIDHDGEVPRLRGLRG